MALSYAPPIVKNYDPLGPVYYVMDLTALRQAADFFQANAGGGGGLRRYVTELEDLNRQIYSDDQPDLARTDPWALYQHAMYRFYFQPGDGNLIAQQGYPQIGAVVEWYTQEGSSMRDRPETRQHALDLVRKSR